MTHFKISPELSVAAIASIALHAVWLVRDAKASYARDQPTEVLLEAEALPLPPAPKAEPEPQVPANLHPEPVARSTPRSPSEQRAAPPSAAQAGKTLTAPETPDNSSMVDFSMVQGEGAMYAGGTTSSIGTSATAVRGPASDKAVAAPRSSVAPSNGVLSGPDRRRGATPVGTDWNCSSLFPSDPGAGDFARVVIAVTVQANGKPQSAFVIRDPGHGFAAAAKACAMQQRYNSALDRDGNAIVATTPPIVVRFTR
jgi:periplasmic protein TonB